jgi:hypothetical protein
VLTLGGLYAIGYTAGQNKKEKRLAAEQELLPKFSNLEEFDAWGDQITDAFFHNGIDEFMPQQPLETLKANNIIGIRHAESVNNRIMGITGKALENVLGITR